MEESSGLAPQTFRFDLISNESQRLGCFTFQMVGSARIALARLFAFEAKSSAILSEPRADGGNGATCTRKAGGF